MASCTVSKRMYTFFQLQISSYNTSTCINGVILFEYEYILSQAPQIMFDAIPFTSVLLWCEKMYPSLPLQPCSRQLFRPTIFTLVLPVPAS